MDFCHVSVSPRLKNFFLCLIKTKQSKQSTCAGICGLFPAQPETNETKMYFHVLIFSR